MSLITILLIAVGLSMDAFAVSVSNGAVLKKDRLRNGLVLSLAFGFFQALMPVIGWFAGSTFKGFVEGYDHWIAFALLVFVGGKMIFEAFSSENVDKKEYKLTLLIILTLAVATSIDALAVGISLAMLAVKVIYPALIIGLTTFGISFAGFFLGSKLGSFLEKKAEFVGGVVLIGIGVKILLSHTAIF